MNFVGRDKRLLFKIMKVSVQDLYIEQNFDLIFVYEQYRVGNLINNKGKISAEIFLENFF